jgi:hypothetical protein
MTMKRKQISVLAVPVGEEPSVRLIEPDLKSLQEFVGGNICSQAIAPNLSLYANDDGLRRRLPYNRCGFVGNFLITKISAFGNGISMTDKDVAKAQEWLARNAHRPPLCHVCGGPGGATMFCPCRDVLIYCVGCYDRLLDVMDSEDLTLRKRWSLCPRCRPLPQFDEKAEDV